MPTITPVPPSVHPMPFDDSDDVPNSQADAVAVAVNTIDLIEQLGGSVDFNEKDGSQAVDLITKAAKSPQHIKVPGQAKAAQLLLRQHDYVAVEDAQQARNFITNRLIELAGCGDLKIEIKALELLGKHSDIGIFTDRSEITVHHTTSKGLEDSIKDRIKRLLNTDASVLDITPLDDLDLQLGVSQKDQDAAENPKEYSPGWAKDDDKKEQKGEEAVP